MCTRSAIQMFGLHLYSNMAFEFNIYMEKKFAKKTACPAIDVVHPQNIFQTEF